MSEANYSRDPDKFKLLLAATADAYVVWQLPSGEAAFLDRSSAGSSGSYAEDFRTRGKVNLAKATGIVLLPGQEVYWDHSANNVTFWRVDDRDFLVGTVTDGATSAATTVEVDLNKWQRFVVDINNDPTLSTIIGTQAIDTMGLYRRGSAHKIILSATNEAQKVDILSVDGFATGANAIIEGIFRVPSDGAGTVVDVSLGVANATHATDADSITESIFIHLNANSTTIYAESDDGTTEVAATDTTTTYTEGSAVANRKHFMMDMRDPTDVQIYVNCVLVLGATVFNVNAATGPWFLLAHVEKTASTDTYELAVDKLRAWTSEQ